MSSSAGPALMPAVRLHRPGTPPRLDDVPVPEPGPGELRVAVRACGICGSDLHLLDGTTRAARLPMVLGHEAAGVVDRLGPDTPGPQVGTPVAVAAGYGCGSCVTCVSGQDNRCPGLQMPGITRDGAQAGYLVVPARATAVLPDGVDFALGAVLTDAVATPFHAIRRSGVTAGQTAVVYGLGGLGMPAVGLLRDLGVRVVGVDNRAAALHRARAFGAAHVVDASAGTPARAVRKLTEGGADAAFEFVGDAAVVDQAVKSLRPGGSCTVVGVATDRLVLGLRQETLVRGELRLQGSFGCTPAELAELVGMLADGRLHLDGLVTHRFGLAQFDQAFRVLADKVGDPVRVVVQP